VLVLMLAMFGLIALLLYCTRLPLWLLYTVIPFGAVLLAGVPADTAWTVLTRGAADQLSTGALILSTTAFFSLLSETGLFRAVTMRLLPGGQVSLVRLCCCAFFAALAVSLCGLPSIVYLVVVSAFLPYFRRMGADVRLLGLAAALAMGVGIAWPWSSKTLLLAQIASVDGFTLFGRILPLMLLSIVFCIICLKITCKKNTKSIYIEKDASSGRESRVGVYGALFAAAIVSLSCLRAQAVWIILGETAVLAALIYREHADRAGCFRRMAKRSIPLAMNMVAVGAFHCLMEETGVLAAIAQAVASLLSESVVPVLPAIFAGLSGVILLVLPFQSIYAILPVMTALAAGQGIGAAEVVLPFVLCFPAAVLPSLPSVGVIDEMLEQPPRSHFRYAWLPVSAVHILAVLVGSFTVF